MLTFGESTFKNMPKYIKIYQNIPKYSKLYQNIPKICPSYKNIPKSSQYYLYTFYKNIPIIPWLKFSPITKIYLKCPGSISTFAKIYIKYLKCPFCRNIPKNSLLQKYNVLLHALLLGQKYTLLSFFKFGKYVLCTVVTD